MRFSPSSVKESGRRVEGHVPRRRASSGAYLSIIALFLVAMLRIAAAGDQNAAIGGPFALIDQTGRQVSDADFRGKLLLVYFGYTFCPNVCPTTLFTIGQAMDRLTPDERKQVAAIFITVDPERDTQKVLAEYVANF
jgi:cytochrome oxidase Cu insertion factor (SCO1/SenC/PrrC family)